MLPRTFDAAKPSHPVWTALIALGAATAIGAHYLGAQWVHWIAKPLTTVLVVGMSLSLPLPSSAIAGASSSVGCCPPSATYS